jgi:hypothetical protein
MFGTGSFSKIKLKKTHIQGNKLSFREVLVGLFLSYGLKKSQNNYNQITLTSVQKPVY